MNHESVLGFGPCHISNQSSHSPLPGRGAQILDECQIFIPPDAVG